MEKTILTDIDKQAFLEALEADPEWSFEVMNRLLKRKEKAESFREWLGIDKLERAIEHMAEAQQKTEQQLQALTQRFDTLTSRVDTLTSRVDDLAEAQQRTEQQVQALTQRLDTLTSRVDTLTSRVDTLASRVDDLAEAQKKTEQQIQKLTQRIDVLDSRVDTLTSRVDVLAEAQQKTEEKVDVLAHHVGTLSEVLGPTWEEEARESIAFLLPKSGVRLLAPLEAQDDNEWDGVAEGEWEGRSVQIRMEAKISAGAGRIMNFANKAKSYASKTGVEIIPIFCGMRLYAGAREEAQRQKIVLVGIREIRNEIPLSIFTITPQNA